MGNQLPSNRGAAAPAVFLLWPTKTNVRHLGDLRGTVYTAAEMRRELQIGDPAIVLEIHEWKRRFDARLREYQERKGEQPNVDSRNR